MTPVRIAPRRLKLQIDTRNRPSAVGIFPTNRAMKASMRQVKFTRRALLRLHFFLFLGYHRGAVPLRDA
jgi:hypothetical protein